MGNQTAQPLPHGINLSLCQVIMTLHHPSNKKFALFHLVDKSQFKTCHVLTVLKSAKSYAHAMIAGLLPYLLWHFMDNADSANGPSSPAGSSSLPAFAQKMHFGIQLKSV